MSTHELLKIYLIYLKRLIYLYYYSHIFSVLRVQHGNYASLLAGSVSIYLNGIIPYLLESFFCVS